MMPGKSDTIWEPNVRTINLVHPELRTFLETVPFPDFDAARVAAMRETPAPLPPPPEVPNVKVEERRVPGPKGAPDVRVLVYRPTDAAGLMPAVLHLHGGGFVIGAPEMNDGSNRLQSAALKAVIVSVDYRLPPEHPFPAPMEDSYAALKWLHDNAAELGVDPARIAVKGESAGGGLAAGLALLARDRGEVPLIFQCLTYPMIDDRSPAEPHPYTGEFIWTRPSNRYGWACYLGAEPGGKDVSPYAAPARAESLAGLPPTLIITLALDLFLEENLEYARRLTRAGVPLELLVYPGAFHGFHMAGPSALSERSDRDLLAALALGLKG
jgi:acetyl esterase/lipase